MKPTIKNAGNLMLAELHNISFTMDIFLKSRLKSFLFMPFIFLEYKYICTYVCISCSQDSLIFMLNSHGLLLWLRSPTHEYEKNEV